MLDSIFFKDGRDIGIGTIEKAFLDIYDFGKYFGKYRGAIR